MTLLGTITHSRLAAAVLAAALTTAIVATAAATNGATNPQYTGCLSPGGQISHVAIGASPQNACARSDAQITWSQTGPEGPAGTSVTSVTEPAGANCPNGGSRFTSASGTTYTCNGTPGPKGDTGPVGPSNLAALRGSPCTYDGNASTVDVSIDPTTGTVTLTCTPVPLTVSVIVSGAQMNQIDLSDDTHTFEGTACFDASSCSTSASGGDHVSVVLISGDTDAGGGKPFSFTCPGGPTEEASQVRARVSGVVYAGACPNGPGPGYSVIAADYAVTASFDG